MAERPNIARLILDGAEGLSDKAALIDGARRMTYHELVGSVRRAADVLRAAGVAPLQRVAFLCHDGIDYVVLSLAVLLLDAAIVPIAPGLMSDECATLIEQMDVHGFLFDDALKVCEDGVRLSSEGWGAKTFRLLARSPCGPDPEGYAAIRPAFIRFSSGTTGTSKGVVLSHEAILERTDAANEGLGVSSADVVGWVLSMSFHFVVTILLFLRKGATVVVCGDPMPHALINALSTHRVTLLYASPLHYRLLASASALTRERFASLRLAVSTAVKLPLAVADAFEARFGVCLAEAYGIIEVGLPFIHRAARDGVLGKPLLAYTVKLSDSGEVLIRGKGLFDAYFTPWRTREAFQPDGWFHTGDLGELSGDGSLRLVGRCKQVINFSGMKIFPQEIEEVVNRFPGVSESLVYGEPHPEYGQLPCAKIVLAAADRPFDEMALHAFCRERLAVHKIPKRFRVVTALPKTASGKIRRA